MASKHKIDPYRVDEDNHPLTNDEVKRLRPGHEVFKELGMESPKRTGKAASGQPQGSCYPAP